MGNSEIVESVKQEALAVEEWEYLTFESAKAALRTIQEAVVVSYGGDLADAGIQFLLSEQNERIIRGLQLPPAA